MACAFCRDDGPEQLFLVLDVDDPDGLGDVKAAGEEEAVGSSGEPYFSHRRRGPPS